MQKVAVVTGGGSGLGREMALALAAAGFAVTVTGRTEAKLRETAAAAESVVAVGAAGVGGVRTAVLDVADGAAVAAFFGGLDRIDLLVNNAGTGAPAAAIQDVSEADWRRVIELEGRAHGITCGQIDIGNAATSMTAKMGQGVLQPDGSIAVEPTFDPRIVADFVVRIAQLPTDVAVPALTVLAAGMPYAGRG